MAALVAIALACCTAAGPAANAPTPAADTVAVYSQVVSAIRGEQAPGSAEKVYLADERYQFPRGGASRHPAELLRELASRGVVDGVYVREQRSESYPCAGCTRIVLGALTEYHRTL